MLPDAEKIDDLICFRANLIDQIYSECVFNQNVAKSPYVDRLSFNPESKYTTYNFCANEDLNNPDFNIIICEDDDIDD